MLNDFTTVVLIGVEISFPTRVVHLLKLMSVLFILVYMFLIVYFELFFVNFMYLSVTWVSLL